MLAIDSFGNTTYSKTSTASVSVSIIDVNDNHPVFSSNSYAFNVSENTTFPTVVDYVTATDADSPLHGGTISYSILEAEKVPFFIDRLNGICFVCVFFPFDFVCKRFTMVSCYTFINFINCTTCVVCFS